MMPTVTPRGRRRHHDAAAPPSRGAGTAEPVLDHEVQAVETAATAGAGLAPLADIFRGVRPGVDAGVYLGFSDRRADADVHHSSDHPWELGKPILITWDGFGKSAVLAPRSGA